MSAMIFEQPINVLSHCAGVRNNSASETNLSETLTFFSPFFFQFPTSLALAFFRLYTTDVTGRTPSTPVQLAAPPTHWPRSLIQIRLFSARTSP